MDIREGVRSVYSSAAENPDAKLPFPVGRKFAESVGYPQDLLDSLPRAAVDVFTGVSNVAVFAQISPGNTVLELGCGGGLDSLIAALRVGPSGKVIGVDFSDSMIFRAKQAMKESGISNIELYSADAAKTPVADESVDVALVNGIFNLNPARDAIFQELARVLRKGGVMFGAELIRNTSGDNSADKNQCNLDDWFA